MIPRAELGCQDSCESAWVLARTASPVQLDIKYSVIVQYERSCSLSRRSSLRSNLLFTSEKESWFWWRRNLPQAPTDTWTKRSFHVQLHKLTWQRTNWIAVYQNRTRAVFAWIGSAAGVNGTLSCAWPGDNCFLFCCKKSPPNRVDKGCFNEKQRCYVSDQPRNVRSPKKEETCVHTERKETLRNQERSCKSAGETTT